jgi:PD-(D/E)XK endonuclease
MPNQGQDIKHHKRRGEWAELRFMARAAEYGLIVTKPWGDSSRYDFAVECKGRFLRVQVKSTIHRISNSFLVRVHGSAGRYSEGDFDFIAAYIIPLDIWYIVPAETAIPVSENLCLTPNSAKSKYECYREAWHLLQGKELAASSVSAETAAGVEDGDPPQENPPGEAESHDDAHSLFVSSFRAIKWNPVFPRFKPRR